jgi:hypothetical protein
MSEKVKIVCPRCKHKWEQSLDELEKVETIYKDNGDKHKDKLDKYRAICPNDGTYIIIEIKEDNNG